MIISNVAEGLRSIMTGENKQLNCESSLKDELNKNIKLFKSIGQPSYLINQMI